MLPTSHGSQCNLATISTSDAPAIGLYRNLLIISTVIVPTPTLIAQSSLPIISATGATTPSQCIPMSDAPSPAQCHPMSDAPTPAQCHPMSDAPTLVQCTPMSDVPTPAQCTPMSNAPTAVQCIVMSTPAQCTPMSNAPTPAQYIVMSNAPTPAQCYLPACISGATHINLPTCDTAPCNLTTISTCDALTTLVNIVCSHTQTLYSSVQATHHSHQLCYHFSSVQFITSCFNQWCYCCRSVEFTYHLHSFNVWLPTLFSSVQFTYQCIYYQFVTSRTCYHHAWHHWARSWPKHLAKTLATSLWF